MLMNFFLTAIVLIFISTTNLFSQLSLEVVWEKQQVGVIDAKFSPDGKFVYCLIGGDIKKLDVQTGEFVATFDRSTFTNKYSYLVISPDGKFIITGGYDGSVNLWNTEQQKIVRSLSIPGQTEKQSLIYTSFSPENKTVLITLQTSHDFPSKPTNEIVLYDFIENKVIKKIPYKRIEQLHYSKDGKYFITGTAYEGTPKVTLWDAATFEPIRDYEVPEGNDNGFTKIQISDNNKLIGVNVYSQNIFVHIIETETGNVVATNKFGTAGGNFAILQNDYFIIYEVASFEDYGLSIYKYPNIFQSRYEKGGGDVLISYEKYDEVENKLLVFQAHVLGMSLLTKSTTSANDPIKPEFNIKVEPDTIFINFDTADSIKIIDMQGNALLEISTKDNNISIPNIYPAGTYICVVKSGDKEYSQKFQVVR